MTAGGASLTSTRNPRVRAASALRRRRERDATGLYLVEGPRYVADLLPTGDVDEVFATPDAVADVAPAAEAAGTTLTLVSPDVLERIATSVTPQGVVAVARQRRHALPDVLRGGFAVALAEVADPGNAGAVLRTCAAAGADGVALTAGSVDPWNPKAVRASAGAVGRIPVVVDVTLDELVQACRSTSTRIVALDASAATSIREVGALRPPVLLLFGNEAHGLPADALDSADLAVSIPRYGPVESLNLAAAVAVTAYAAAFAAEPGRAVATPSVGQDR